MIYKNIDYNIKEACFENTFNPLKSESLYFYDPEYEIITKNPEELIQCFLDIDFLRKKNFYLLGYISYESSYYLNQDFKILRKILNYDFPLIHFVAFKKMLKSNLSLNNIHNKGSKDFFDMIYDVHKNFYNQDYKNIKQNLLKGISYQINYTKNLKIRSTIDNIDLYNKIKIHQPVKYSAFLPYNSVSALSFSPELFFDKTGSKISMKPMKGTANCTGNKILDDKILNKFKKNKKILAENLIIVDLIRNDLCKICDIGSVKVDKLFEIEKYKTLYQMTSSISGDIKRETDLLNIIKNIFPCGSVTGAPKLSTMMIIKNLEKYKRNIYTGCIGYILPNNDMKFNVAIRTLYKLKTSLYTFGVGNGFTIKSIKSQELAEMNTKIKFLVCSYKPSFLLIETLLYKNKKFRSLNLHLKRLKNSADKFLFKINLKNLKHEILKFLIFQNLDNFTKYKFRITLNFLGKFTFKINKIYKPEKIIKLFIYPKCINSENPLWNHKTNDYSTRGFYNAMHKIYIKNKKNAELIYFNQHGYLTEARLYNIIIKINDIFYTPKLENGVLNGIARYKLLMKNIIIEKSITKYDLLKATNIYLINDVISKLEAELII